MGKRPSSENRISPAQFDPGEKNKGLLFSNGSIGKRHRKLSLWNNYCSGVTWLCVYFFLCFIFLLRDDGG